MLGCSLLAAATILVAVIGPPDVNPMGTWELTDGENAIGEFAPTENGTMTVVNNGPGPILASIEKPDGTVDGPYQLNASGSVSMPMTPEDELHLDDIIEGQSLDSAGTWAWVKS